MLKYIFKTIEKKLRFGYVAAAGRNFQGVICVRHRGNGNKRRGFFVDFFRRTNLFGYVSKIQKSPFYTGYLGLIIYQNGISCYILLSEKLKTGAHIYSGSILMKDKEANCFSLGSSLPISYMPLFSIINNIELYPFRGGKLIRAAGASAIISTKLQNKVSIKLKSGWNLTLSNFNMCTLGQVSNSLYRFYNFKKAGRIRALGIRPTVRGVAMNPCDHPHGGGEGRKSPPVAARSPWGWLTKGTASNKKVYQIAKKKLLKKVR